MLLDLYGADDPDYAEPQNQLAKEAPPELTTPQANKQAVPQTANGNLQAQSTEKKTRFAPGTETAVNSNTTTTVYPESKNAPASTATATNAIPSFTSMDTRTDHPKPIPSGLPTNSLPANPSTSYAKQVVQNFQAYNNNQSSQRGPGNEFVVGGGGADADKSPGASVRPSEMRDEG
jgi:hypothetical protein